MKKTYISPSVMVNDVKSQTILAGSPLNVNNGATAGNGGYGGPQSKKHYYYDDEEDEEIDW